MKLKSMSVDFPLNLHMMTICRAFEQTTEDELVITSGTDGNHSEHSLHKYGLALDIRVHNQKGFLLDEFDLTRDVIDEWITRAKMWLVKHSVAFVEDYDIVFGDERHRNHIHVEYDPK